MQITAEMVAEAEAEVTEAEKVRGDAEAALMESPNSAVKAQELAGALRRVAQVRANVRELREAYDRQVAAERAASTREEREKSAAKDITAAGKDLKAAAGVVEKAAAAAQDALVTLMSAAETYDGLVARHADVLAAAGLGLDGATGGGRGLLDVTVRVRGTSYESLAPSGALLWVAQRVGEARLSPMHPVRASLTGLLGYRVWEQRGDDLMSGVPAVPEVKHPDPPRVVNAYQALQAAK